MSVVARRPVLVVDGFVGEETIQGLQGLLARVSEREPSSAQCRRDGPDLNVVMYREAIARHAHTVEQAVFERTITRIVDAIQNTYEENLVEECSLMVRLGAGTSMAAHADSQTWSGEPNHTPTRSHVGLLYLRQPARGGVLRVWDAENPDVPVEEYEARPGRLVCFPSTRNYFHEVTTVEDGERWNCACWVKRLA